MKLKHQPTRTKPQKRMGPGNKQHTFFSFETAANRRKAQ
jgi:hypothetical protein